MLEKNNDRPSASTPAGETGRKASLRWELERRPWLLIAIDSNHSCPDRLAQLSGCRPG